MNKNHLLDSEASNRGKENFDIGPSNQFGIHAVGHTEDGMAKIGFGGLKPTSNFGKVPNWFYCSFRAN